jgi:uncharacterized protein
MNEAEVYRNTIYRVVHGSRAYGTHRPDSDRDEKGVCIPTDPSYYFGSKNFEQKDKGWSDNNDRVIYDIRKFFNLALSCNPNIIEILYADESDIIDMDDLGEELRANRDMFLSRAAARTFVGYAVSQLHRIRGHKKWLDNPPERPEEEDFWHEHVLTYKDRQFAREFDGHEFIVYPAEGLDLEELVGEKLAKVLQEAQGSEYPLSVPSGPVIIKHFDKVAFKAANKKFGQYTAWRRDRNPDRAAIEAEHGFDRKHAYHLIRLLRMGKEIITEGKVLVRRPDAQELLDIRNGKKYTYDELVAYAEELKEEVNLAVAGSPLPKAPDTEAAEKLLLKLIRAQLS